MARWHCPHCGAPQAETARCWVCRRSSTTCSTCRHFRASLATDVSYCALDRRRRPLTGLELRGCWSERPADAQAAARLASSSGRQPSGEGPGTAAAGATRSGVARDFVPVEAVRPSRTGARIEAPNASAGQPDVPELITLDSRGGWEARTSLFGDPDR